VEEIDCKGRVTKRYSYNKINTPFEKLKSIPVIENYLRQDVSLNKMQNYADQMSDNNFAERVVKAHSNLCKQT